MYIYILIVQINIGYLGYQQLPSLKESCKANYGKQSTRCAGRQFEQTHCPPTLRSEQIV